MKQQTAPSWGHERNELVNIQLEKLRQQAQQRKCYSLVAWLLFEDSLGAELRAISKIRVLCFKTTGPYNPLSVKLLHAV